MRDKKAEARSWFVQAKAEFEDADVPVEFFDDPEECRDAQVLARVVIELVEKKIRTS